ncbi:MAG: DUF2945 domain-containing protein [Cytophagales bacterium]|nr:MAG: DUF2945 domain-containing protein [Cytophagales bacterium]
MATVKKGDQVEWNYAGHKAEGTVDKVKSEDTTIKTQGKTVKRKGSKEEPAVVISQGKKKIVKSASEVTKK